MKIAIRSRVLTGVVLAPLLAVAVSIFAAPRPATAQAATGITGGGHGYLRHPDGHFTAVDVPGATGTMPMGITNQGQIAGTYDDVSGRSHAFVLLHGRYSTLDHPQATGEATSYGLSGTVASGINERGEIVGSYVGANGAVHGFLYARGEFTPIDVPGAQENWPFGINNRGQVTVQTVRADGSQPQYLLTNTTLTPITYPAAKYSIVHRVNDHGVVVGVYVNAHDTTPQHGFVLAQGKYARFDIPGAAYTGVNAASNNGDLTGYYVPEGSPNGHAFISSSGRITSFDAPDAAGTTAYDINDQGQIVGTGFPAITTARASLPHQATFPRINFHGVDSEVIPGMSRRGQ
ncbi:hypothetical protein [Actinomadura oligospora]|uniref:hypothetical protein n=1 Tax=Actinomadura oligospora TaxID=111804 RepID=UPI0004B1AECB|nr:hypothetical protein [Actinomadura oligospora]